MVQLSDQAIAWAQEQATLAGFATLEEYLEALIKRERDENESKRLSRDRLERECAKLDLATEQGDY